MDYRNIGNTQRSGPVQSHSHTIDLAPQREVSIFILKNKKWVDVYSGNVTFQHVSHDAQTHEYRVAFRSNQLSQTHVYKLQNKIRRKGPKAFVVRATGANQAQEVGDCILAFRFENDGDAFNFQHFMENAQYDANNRGYSRAGRNHHKSQSRNNLSHRYSGMRGESPSMVSVPTLEGSIRSREPAQVNVLPLTEENLLLHDARMPPRPRKVADILRKEFIA